MAPMAYFMFEIDNTRHVEPPLLPGYVAPKLSNSAVYAMPGRYTASKTALQLGVGVEFQAWDSASLRLEYENYGRFGSETATGRSQVSLTSLSLVYFFK